MVLLIIVSLYYSPPSLHLLRLCSGILNVRNVLDQKVKLGLGTGGKHCQTTFDKVCNTLVVK